MYPTSNPVDQQAEAEEVWDTFNGDVAMSERKVGC